MMSTSRVSSRASRRRYADTTRFNNSNLLCVICHMCIVFPSNEPLMCMIVLFLLLLSVLFIAPLALEKEQKKKRWL